MRIKKNINENWEFRKLPKNGGSDAWININLPHTWNSEDGCDGQKGCGEYAEGYYRGIGEYRKEYFAAGDIDGKEVFIEFEGANTVTELFVNGIFAGRHDGGYSAFRFDITDKIFCGKNNIFTVRVNNAPTDYIAPITDQGDFTKMGGIYRSVNLIFVEKIHISLSDFGSPGIYITPKNITSQSADIDILVKITNKSVNDEKITVRAETVGKTAAEAARETAAKAATESSENEVITAAKSDSEISLKLKIKNPVLWNGTKNPYLYNAKITLIKDGVIYDEYIQTFGIRTYTFDREKGFFLNGEYTDLRGTNYHQDSYQSGWAMTKNQQEEDYGIMLEMGCNAIRMAHYQHGGYEYDLCDKFGIAVWTEIGIVNKMSADDDSEHRLTDKFINNAANQLKEIILQNYNHPSIIVWGISNELYQMTDEIFDFYGRLSALAKSLDGTRPVTCADNQGYGRFLKLPVDVIGYNRYFGWYQQDDQKGGADELGHWLDFYHKNKTELPLCLSEYGGGGAVSQHKDNVNWRTDIVPWGTPHYENYQSELHERLWAQLSMRPFVWGKFIWCMFDFASDGRNEGDTHGQNDKGLCTRKRMRKDAFYFYKSVWNSEPMIHITEKRFDIRPSAVPRVKVYSNAKNVELFVNGFSAGKIERRFLDPCNPTVFIWKNILLKVGEANEIKAVAVLEDGTVIEDTAVWYGENDGQDKSLGHG